MLMPVVKGVEWLRGIVTFEGGSNNAKQPTKFLNRDKVVGKEAIPIEGREGTLPTLVQERIHASTQAEREKGVGKRDGHVY